MSGNFKMLFGDASERLRDIPDNSIDSLVTDPPYGLSQQPDMVEVLTHWLAGDDYKHTGAGFMARLWDSFVPGPSLWKEVFRVLKPGGHGLVFAGTRTVDLMGVSLRLAGFEIRDTVTYHYANGFPKSHNISKALDKAADAKREVVGKLPVPRSTLAGGPSLGGGWTAAPDLTAPATAAAKEWDGWGTALKPATEPIILIRKPVEGTIAGNVLKWGTGALNIDGCRIGTAADMNPSDFNDARRTRPKFSGVLNGGKEGQFRSRTGTVPNGRWPANLIFSHSPACVEACGEECPVAELDRQSGFSSSDAGGASRFFFVAKPSKRERNYGCDALEHKTAGQVTDRKDGSKGLENPRAGAGRTSGARNFHPTVKPVTLMRYLCRMVTPPGGIVLDPFMGSGTTALAALIEGFNCIGVEMTPEYLPIIEARLQGWRNQDLTILTKQEYKEYKNG